MLAAACGSSDDSPSVPASEIPTATAGPAASPTGDASACAPGRPHQAGSFDDTLMSGGVAREYILHVPPSYTGSDAVPLVVNLHGFAGSAQAQARNSALPAKADEEGFIVVTPQATGDPAQWDIVADSSDVTFIDDLLDELTADLCIDQARVYVTGLSNGAAMTVTLACQLSDRIAAIAPVAGVYSCPPTEPVSVIAFHGDADPAVPFEGGRVGGEDSGLAYPPVEESMRQWADHDGCDEQPVSERAAESARVVRYAGCDRGTSVELYVVEGGGHSWPGAAVGEISATDLMWEFFETHPKR